MDIESTFCLVIKFCSKLILHTNLSIYKIKHFKHYKRHIPITVKLLATTR